MPKLLLVDDHPELADVIRQLLEIHGHQVDMVGDAESAVERLQSDSYAALITDDRLPGMSGIDMVRNVRGNGKHSDLYMVVCSADSTGRDAALDAGADAFWLKGSDQLFDSLEKLQSHL